MDANGNIRRDDISIQELCAWANAYQEAHWPQRNPDFHIASIDDAGGPACFLRSAKTIYLEKATTSSEKFSRIALLHEMIHINLVEDGGDPDEAHEARFQGEVRRLFEAGAYRNLL